MHIKRLCFILLGILTGIGLSAQDSVFVNSQGIEFILIKPGKMVVGKFEPTVNRGGGFGGSGGGAAARPASQERPSLPGSDFELAEEMARADALPGFEVEIERSFYIGKYEITQGQWKDVMGSNPSYFQGEVVEDNADLHPVECVSWQDAQDFIEKLNALDQEHTYRLPTEFEWEFAARAGAVDDISWDDIRASAVIASGTTSEAGTMKPNAWGLYDMLGNVWEWVQDYYNEKIFADPVPSETGNEHVLKGAPFYGDVKNATYMTHAGGPGSKYDVGFRLVMETRPGTEPELPEGFTPVFNGVDLEGWHISRSTHQGTTPRFTVEDGVIVGRHEPYGQGGILLTDKNYHSFELYAEVLLDSFCNSGIFLRSNEGGAAYQVELVVPGNNGALLGERLRPSVGARADGWENVWKAGDWNSFRVRMEGDVPHLTLWINDSLMWDVQETRNDFLAGATEGMIGLQCHWTALYSGAAGPGMPLTSWRPGRAIKFRNIGIMELK